MDKLVIRYAAAKDVEEVYRFVCELEETIFDPQQFQQYYLQNIGKENHHYLIALVNDEAVGYLSCHGQLLLHHMGMAYEIQELYVDKNWRSKGIGKQLLNALETILAKKPYDILELTSRLHRKDAHRFYEKHGFTNTHLKFTKKGNSK
jgi:PhnO protein